MGPSAQLRREGPTIRRQKGTAMHTAADIIEAKGAQIISVDTDTTVRAALEQMVERKVGATLVTDQGQIVGIWTERDLMRDVLDPGFDPHQARIGNHMVTGLQYAPHTDTVHELMDKFLGLRLRHLLINNGEELIGLLSIGDVIRACLQAKSLEFEQLKAAVSWEYYEEWAYPKP
jgi:CBS domain-containing protein